MKNTTLPRPAKTSNSVLRQIVHWIPEGLPDRMAREANADIRTFSCTSHVVDLLYGQFNRAASLNETRSGRTCCAQGSKDGDVTGLYLRAGTKPGVVKVTARASELGQTQTVAVRIRSASSGLTGR